MERDFEEELQDPDTLRLFIKEWNESRLDMFALSQPNENLEISGVVRFYFQDRGQKAVTKCIRVRSTQTVADIMSILIEKFCPDMKMLSTPNYELFEIHANGDVRKLEIHERPLFVQMSWQKDDREGRFLLKSADLKLLPSEFFELNQDEGQLKRRLSRREKKEMKKKRKEMIAMGKHNTEKALADHLYKELPETSLTRSISNPEAVMRRRRQQKLEKRMKEFQNKGGPQTGGILKIFAESLRPEIPYKTILASVKDNARTVVAAALEKFQMEKEDPDDYLIVMAIIPPNEPGAPGSIGKEKAVRPDDCPLAIQNSWPASRGFLTFHLRKNPNAKPKDASKNVRRPVESQKSVPFEKSRPEKRGIDQTKSISPSNKVSKPLEVGNKKPLMPPQSSIDQPSRDSMPYLLELTPEGKEIRYRPKVYYIKPDVTVIGSSRSPAPGEQYLQLFSPNILAQHCMIANFDSNTTISPFSAGADVHVNGQQVTDTSILRNGDVVQFGKVLTFRFCNPREDVENGEPLDLDESSSHNQSREMGLPPYRPPQAAARSSGVPPELKEFVLNEVAGSHIDEDTVVETTFGVDGEIETNKKQKESMQGSRSTSDLLDARKSRDSSSHDPRYRRSAPDLKFDMHESDGLVEGLLPASLQFMDQGKDAFLAAIVSDVNAAAVNFKLAPTYSLYMAARYVLSSGYRPDLSTADRARIVAAITKKIALSIQQTIQENDNLAGSLAFWMANASELLHFYRQDIDLSPISQSCQAILAQSIQEAFALLVNAMEEELSLAMPAFFDLTDSVDIHPRDLEAILNDDVLERAESMELLNWTSTDPRTFAVRGGGYSSQPVSGEQWVTPAARIRNQGMPIMADVLYILSSAMSLLRRCRVNAALTIQLFSQLFHFINMWLFNRIVLEPDLGLCTMMWGSRLRMRLSFIEAWAERQGLELAADCHLARIVQAAHVLEADKSSSDDVAAIASTCFKLNSLQLRVLLGNYVPDRGEPPIPTELIESVVAVAEKTADELTRSDGREVKLEEDIQLQLPFLLPEEGYSCDIIRGVPPGLQEFLDPLTETGLCRLIINPSSMGVWTVYQEPYDQADPDSTRSSEIFDDSPIQKITINKGKSGLGLSIVAAKGAISDFTGIYVKAVIKGSIAEQDGRVEAGDQILSVNENSLIDCTQAQAAKFMMKSGPDITLEICKRAAFYHGLAHIVKEDGKASKKESTAQDSDEAVSRKTPRGSRNISHDEEDLHVDERKPSIAKVPPTEPVMPNFSPAPPQAQASPASPAKAAKPSVAPKPKAVAAGNADAGQVTSPGRVSERAQSPAADSDYDSEGNFMTAEDKARKARERQRMLEYEERLKAWERAKQLEEEEKRRADDEPHDARLREEEEERRYEAEAARARSSDEQRRRADDTRLAEEKRKADEKLEEEKRRDQERQANEERRLAEERRIAEEKRLAEKRAVEERKAAEERRLAEERKVAEEKRLAEKRAVEERKAAEERRLTEERKVAEEKRLAEKRAAEERRLAEDRRVAEEKRLAEKRAADERKAADDRRLAEERRLADEKRAEEERKIRERERLAAEEQRRTLLLQEEQRVRREEAERQMKEEERVAEERRKQEKQRLAEMRQQRERTLSQWKYEQDQLRAEEETRVSRLREEEVRRKSVDEEARARMYDAEVKREQKNAPQTSNTGSAKASVQKTQSLSAHRDISKEMDSIDDALREAERIAAEMDMFMFEEEQKMEDDVRRKKEAEKKELDRQFEEEARLIEESMAGKLQRHGDEVDTAFRVKEQEFLRQQELERKRVEEERKRNFLAKMKGKHESPFVQQAPPKPPSKPSPRDLAPDIDDLPPPPEDLLAADPLPIAGKKGKGSQYALGARSGSSSDEEEKIMNKLVEEERREKEAFDRKIHLLEEEQQGYRVAEKNRLSQNLERSEVEIEFRRRLEEEKRKGKKDGPDYKGPDDSSRQKLQANVPPPPVRPKVVKPLPSDDSAARAVSAVRGDLKTKPVVEADIRRRELDVPKPTRQTAATKGAVSDDEDAPPRPPPPRPVDTSPVIRAPSVSSPIERKQFNFAASNGVSPTGARGGALASQESSPAEVLDFKAKMRMFGKKQ